MKTDQYYMQRCEVLGKRAGEKGNPPVGTLILKGDKIICEAEEAGKSKNDITCHAEIEAVRMAVNILGTNDLSDCSMYSTHEPCVMCSYVIRFHRIKKVVFKNAVDDLGGVTSSLPMLTTEKVPAHWSPAPAIIHLESESDLKK